MEAPLPFLCACAYICTPSLTDACLTFLDNLQGKIADSLSDWLPLYNWLFGGGRGGLFKRISLTFRLNYLQITLYVRMSIYVGFMSWP